MSAGMLTTYREAFEQLAESRPAAQRMERRRFLERFLEQGFPERHEEAWKYTDLSSLTHADFRPTDHGEWPAGTELPHLANTRRLAFLNGHYDARQSDDAEPPPATALPEATRDGLAALNAALAGNGLNLRLPAGARTDCPVHVLIHHCGETPTMAHLRHHIALEPGAEAEVIFHFTGTGSYFTTQFIDIRLGAGARLKLCRVQDDAANATALIRTDAHVGQDACLQASMVEFGGGLIRHDVTAVLDAPGAEVILNGLYVPVGNSHIDTHSRIEHRAPRGRSRELFRGIAGGRGRGIYDGLVVVARGAEKTDSEQQVANLLLSPKAEVNAKPELEIYNDDVRCSHGAATGALDETALFYLQSRGIEKAIARRLLTRGFASAILQQIPVSSARELIDQRLDHQLRVAIGEE